MFARKILNGVAQQIKENLREKTKTKSVVLLIANQFPIKWSIEMRAILLQRFSQMEEFCHFDFACSDVSVCCRVVDIVYDKKSKHIRALGIS